MIDITKARLGSKVNGRKVEKCPICGKKATIQRYKDGSGMAVHAGTIELGMFFSIAKSCNLGKPATAKY